jgi:DNA-binding winged helix-turn-helix (wHTH) protein/tetratricopeptide (TPR) repeat protein
MPLNAQEPPNERPDAGDQAVAPPAAGWLRFGVFRVDLARRLLLGPDGAVPIQRKPLDVLIFLATQSPRLVSRETLLDRFWSRSVHEESLTRCISTLRKALGDVSDPPAYIETRRGMGYLFVAAVTHVPADQEAPATAPEQGADGGVTGSEEEETDDADGLTRARLEARVAALDAQAAALDAQAAALAARAEAAGNDGRRLRLRRWLSRRRPARPAILLVLLFVLVPGLWLWLRAPPADLIDRIAVLPIASPPAGDEWLAPALTDHLTQAVSRIEGVIVIAPTGPDGADEPLTLGRRLDVDALLVSTLDLADTGLSLRTRLVSARDGALLWTSSATAPDALPRPRQVEDLARAIAARLRPTLQLQSPAPAVGATAYRHYLQGRYYWSQRSSIGLTAARESFDAALALEPDYPDALVGAAETWLLMPLYGAMAPTEAIPTARALATRALRLDPSNARVRAVLGAIAMQFDWDWARAEALLREAVTRNPNDATAQQWLGELYCYTRRVTDCRRHLELARSLDPLSPFLRWLQGSPLLWFGDYAGAASLYADALREVPDFGLGRYSLGLAYAGLGEWDRAIAAYEAALPSLGPAIVNGPLVYALARAGDLPAARARLSELESLSATRYVPPSKLAVAHLGLGDRERAMEWLARAAEVRDDRLVYLTVDVHFRDLHDEPAFREIAAMIGLGETLDTD